MTRSQVSRRLGFSVGILLASAVVLWLVFGGRGVVSTENAYVKARVYSLSADVAGRVVEVAVKPNQRVERGQVLLRLDDTPYALTVAEAEAHLAQVRNQVEARRADYAEAREQLGKALADAEYYERKLVRQERMGPEAVSESALDDARQQLASARAEIAINRQNLSRLKAELGGDPDLPLAAQADVQVAQAQLDTARYKLSRTVIVAPADGIVANEVPDVSEMAIAGMALINMLGTDDLWVEANLKETELAGIQPGQPAVVKLDAYPGREWRAEVDSLSPASGAEFALIPAQNASGNWVKVVQRIPVHLRLLLEGDEPPLRAGMSAHVRIDLKAGSVDADAVHATAAAIASG